jgi:hypothetical protein
MIPPPPQRQRILTDLPSLPMNESVNTLISTLNPLMMTLHFFLLARLIRTHHQPDKDLYDPFENNHDIYEIDSDQSQVIRHSRYLTFNRRRHPLSMQPKPTSRSRSTLNVSRDKSPSGTLRSHSPCLLRSSVF